MSNACQPEKWAFFSFNMPWHYQICITLLKRRFAPKFVQNKGSRMQKVYFLLTCVAQKRRCLRFSRKWWQKMEFIHLPFSNTIFFVYSLRGALIKIARVCHMRWRNYFDGTNPISCHQEASKGFVTRLCPTPVGQESVTRTSAWEATPFLEKVRRYPVAFSLPDYRKHFTFKMVLRFLGMREPHFALT